MAAGSKAIYSVQVRELIEFALRRGDLGRERLFVGPDRALAGTRGHQRLQKSRPDGYQKEVAVSYEVETDDLVLRIQGRIDGLIVTSGETTIEEIKTVQGRWDHLADPLHWAQAKLYAFIYTHEHPLETVAIQLTYLHLERDEVTEFRQLFSRSELAAFFEVTAAIYLDWVRERHVWCRQRDKSIRSLDFPFREFRPGQRKLAVAAYRTLAGGGRLFLEAPTGIGKTISVLFPALKALAEGKLERVFYLTARTVGRTVAETTLADLRHAGLRLRTMTLTAKQKLCIRDGHPCDVNTCPLAIGYYDRCRRAMRDALNREGLTREVLEAISREHQVCPFELSLDLSSWVDAVICDYNYVFDPKVYLRRHFGEQAREYGFLVDEAHNLVDRARDMFSSELDSQQIQKVGRAIKRPLPRCARALARLSAAMQKLCGPTELSVELPVEPDFALGELDLFGRESNTLPKVRSIEQLTRHEGVVTTKELPTALAPIIEAAMEEAALWLARNEPAEFRESLLELYFQLHSFRRTAESYDERYVTIVEAVRSVTVRLFCVDPSHLLRKALERGKAAVFFSATLAPIDYYQSLIGGDAKDPLLQLPSPFPPENLAVLVQDRLRTQHKARAETLAEVVQAIGALIESRRGNYLVYFPSYQYLKHVCEEFQKQNPTVRVLAQRPGMNESERETFLAAFSSEHEQTLAGFAVLGGIFGEGIDLVGERLIGAVIVGVGLPQLCIERDLIRDYFHDQTAAGFDYAYTFPGMNRVLQASGRVIRSQSDRGVVLLIDSRFIESRYRRLFPAWWQPARVKNAGEIRDAVGSYWRHGAAKPQPKC